MHLINPTLTPSSHPRARWSMLLLIAMVLWAATCHLAVAADQEKPLKTAIPTARQLEFQHWEFGLFMHFMISGFDNKYSAQRGDKISPEVFHPTELNCEQWIRLGKEVGMKYAVLTTKHHDGFCLWPSSVTKDWSVAGSKWKDGKGDVVREYTEACRKHGLAVGLYYSPWDLHYRGKDYGEYMLTHLRELLSNYGKIDIIWFDGYNAPRNLDWPRMIKEMRRLQPGLLMFGGSDPDYRWVGNEVGFAPVPCWNTVKRVKRSMTDDSHDTLSEGRWLPAECDTKLRRHWDWHGPKDPLISLPRLMDIYYWSVGRGCNLLLNSAPDTRGLIHEDDAARLIEMGKEIRRRFGRPLCNLTDARRDGLTWTWQPKEPLLIDHVVFAEDIAKGEHIRKYRLVARTPAGTAPVTLVEGSSVGHKAIRQFTPVKVTSVTLEVIEADGEVSLRSLEFHHAAGIP